MPLIHMYLPEGNTLDQKRQLTKEITDVVTKTIKVPKETVIIVIHDISSQNTCIGGTLFVDFKK